MRNLIYKKIKIKIKIPSFFKWKSRINYKPGGRRVHGRSRRHRSRSHWDLHPSPSGPNRATSDVKHVKRRTIRVISAHSRSIIIVNYEEKESPTDLWCATRIMYGTGHDYLPLAIDLQTPRIVRDIEPRCQDDERRDHEDHQGHESEHQASHFRKVSAYPLRGKWGTWPRLFIQFRRSEDQKITVNYWQNLRTTKQMPKNNKSRRENKWKSELFYFSYLQTIIRLNI